MVKTLVLVRHGAPEASSASGADMDRRLTSSGARALRVAYPRTFALLGDDVSAAVWSSPAVRALETADVVAAVTGTEDIEVHQSLYAQDITAFLAELEATDATTVIAVGHAPFVDHLCARLLGGCPAFGKGTAAAIDLPEGASGRGVLRWFVAGPEVASWEELAVVERAVASAASDLNARAEAFLAAPDDADALREFRVSLRRVRSLLQFLEPWQTKKQNRRCEHTLKELQVASARLRSLDILSDTVDGLVESGELGENSLLPTACAKERALECASLITLMRKRHSAKALRKLARNLENLGWKSKVAERGLTAEDFRRHFDDEFNAVDEDLFGLDLRDGDAVYVARRDAKEMHYVAERLGAVLGPDRAQMSEYLDEIQRELGALSDARGNKRLAEECSKSPRFRGVRADLGVVARDQAEVVSAITSGLERREQGAREATEDAEAEGADPAPAVDAEEE
ncbi:CHAD domain-containing protein [Olsenella profusa]|uniref:CHAD domain-containing protein n=1 Tax=Olsenella profusa TaxID=138595 RepID=A0ABS2F3J7_9ACTN|nr:CHAD domain-containing protein [Olsenella profusa]MBM6775556.1 CHAD domain-containing protein [Olsenella profusa]